MVVVTDNYKDTEKNLRLPVDISLIETVVVVVRRGATANKYLSTLIVSTEVAFCYFNCDN